MFYPLERLFVDQFRYYEPEQILGTCGRFTINVNHSMLAAVFLLSAALWLRGWQKSRALHGEATRTGA